MALPPFFHPSEASAPRAACLAVSFNLWLLLYFSFYVRRTDVVGIELCQLGHRNVARFFLIHSCLVRVRSSCLRFGDFRQNHCKSRVNSANSSNSLQKPGSIAQCKNEINLSPKEFHSREYHIIGDFLTSAFAGLSRI